MIHHGSCIDILPELADNSVDSIVTDPPYELGFMGKSWDSTGIAYNVGMWRECLRVLKPGGYLLSFGGSRTYHRMACAIEDAGFEIRDMIEWMYGSGFPKSLNIGKMIDKMNGIETKEWQGYGTALKPAHEPICMARKHLSEKTVAENVLKWGTGGINVDGCRIETSDTLSFGSRELGDGIKYGKCKPTTEGIQHSHGRFPANLIHDGSDEVLACFPDNKGAVTKVNYGQKGFGGVIYGRYAQAGDDGATFYNDGLGSASRFFYCAKASKSERDAGLTSPEIPIVTFTTANGTSGKPSSISDGRDTTYRNFHPTVKPLALMTYLCRLVTPKGGIVLDPFAGSGTTLVAAKKEGFGYIGIEMQSEYIDIINARLSHIDDGQTFLDI